MKKDLLLQEYVKFTRDQIEKAEAEDNIFLFAKKMIKAKDEDGVNLFWDEDEEEFMRRYIEYTENLAEC